MRTVFRAIRRRPAWLTSWRSSSRGSETSRTPSPSTQHRIPGKRSEIVPSPSTQHRTPGKRSEIPVVTSPSTQHRTPGKRSEIVLGQLTSVSFPSTQHRTPGKRSEMLGPRLQFLLPVCRTEHQARDQIWFWVRRIPWSPVPSYLMILFLFLGPR